MGLDAVELLLAVEAEFGVSIADGDAADLRTPRQLADHVAELLGGAPGTAAPCLSQAAFYRLRSVLVDEFGARRRDLHPDTALLDCLGPDLRRQWPRLRQVLKAPYLPRLCCSKQRTALWSLGLPLAGGTVLVFQQVAAGWLLAGLFGLWLGGLYLADWQADRLPPQLTRVRDLLPYVPLPEHRPWTREHILERVLQISSWELGIPVEQIHPDHDYVRDLGVD